MVKDMKIEPIFFKPEHLRNLCGETLKKDVNTLHILINPCMMLILGTIIIFQKKKKNINKSKLIR